MRHILHLDCFGFCFLSFCEDRSLIIDSVQFLEKSSVLVFANFARRTEVEYFLEFQDRVGITSEELEETEDPKSIVYFRH